MKAGLSIAGGLLGVLAVAGCGSVSGGGAGTPPSSPEQPGAAGLRGTQVVSVECDAQRVQPDAAHARAVSGVPVRIVVCPLPMANAAGPPTDLRPAPPALVRALSLPDAPKPPAQYACAAYADVPRLVYAELADGTLYLLHIPVDACSHYLPAAATAVNEYAHEGPVVG
jgi:hypothetical protein